jgi:CheY-like chemotaxis protein
MATILIIDDVTADRRFLVTLLRSQGYRILEAANGREGMAVVQVEHPDLVIADVLMPFMVGYEFVRQLRLDPKTSRIPVLFYTSPNGERDARAFALMRPVGPLTEDQERQLETVRCSARHLLSLVNDLLSRKQDNGFSP